MSEAIRVVWASAALEFQHFARSRMFVLLTLMAAINFLVLVSLFGLTGSMAPTGLIDRDGGPLARRFIDALNHAHHSFRLQRMTAAEADRGLREGRLVAAITIPAGFGDLITEGQTVPLDVRVDNVNVDLTDDVQRALPSAIVAFSHELGLPGINVSVDEHDVLAHDTGYIPYLVVSGLALDALIVAGILGAMVVAREWEGGAVKVWKMWRVAPVNPATLLAGKLLAAAALATVAVAVATLIVVLGYGVVPRDPLEVAGSLLACVLIFTCIGGLLGAVVRRTQAVVPLIFGIAMPFYLDSGALEPVRLDGEILWRVAHLSPVYYAIGVLQAAFHGLRVTPEPPATHFLVLLACAATSLMVARTALARTGTR